jgi:hypothetical protein
MTVSAPEAPQLESPSPKPPRKRVIGAALLFGIGCLGAAANPETVVDWYRNVTSGDGVAVSYPSAEFMADHIVGCRNTFRPAYLPGTSTSSGECDLPNGAHIEFRTFATSQEPFAWLDGARGQSGRLEEEGLGATGPNWAIRVTGTTDRATVNAIFLSLPG